MKRLLVLLLAFVSSTAAIAPATSRSSAHLEFGATAAAAPGPGFFAQRPPIQQGLKGWWRADGPHDIATPPNVSSWHDESPTGAHWVRFGVGWEATIVATVQNGLPAIRTSNVSPSTELQITNPLVGATAAEIVAVMKSRSAAGTDNHTAWAWGGYYNSVFTSWVGYFGYTDSKIYDDFGSTTRPGSAAVTGSAVASIFIYDAYVSGATKDAWLVNGSGQQHIQNAVANTIGWAATAYLGATPGLGWGPPTDQSSIWNGEYYEIMVFNRVLSHAERVAVYAYLDRKWSLGGPTAP